MIKCQFYAEIEQLLREDRGILIECVPCGSPLNGLASQEGRSGARLRIGGNGALAPLTLPLLGCRVEFGVRFQRGFGQNVIG